MLSLIKLMASFKIFNSSKVQADLFLLSYIIKLILSFKIFNNHDTNPIRYSFMNHFLYSSFILTFINPLDHAYLKQHYLIATV